LHLLRGLGLRMPLLLWIWTSGSLTTWLHCRIHVAVLVLNLISLRNLSWLRRLTLLLMCLSLVNL
jgi:hypothetical protein